jgi:hypothetical protein
MALEEKLAPYDLMPARMRSAEVLAIHPLLRRRAGPRLGASIARRKQSSEK